MRRASALAIALIALVILSPVLWSGWTADDAFYSALNGILGADHLTLGQAMARSFTQWYFGNGRFYPGLILEKYLVFAIFTNLVVYKVLLVALTLGALELFRRFVRELCGDACAAAAALCAAALFLVHGYGDALIAYNGMPQVVAILLFASLIAFCKALRAEDVALGIAAALLYAAAAVTYEDVYLLCLLYLLIALRERPTWRGALTAAWPQVCMAVVLIVFELWLHARAKLPPDALYALRFQPETVASTALYQLTAPLPLLYWIADPPAMAWPTIYFAFVSVGALVAAGAGMRDLFDGTMHSFGNDGRERWPWAIGALLAILPALPVAVLVKYQEELRLGLGYLPDFIQIFGLALLAAGCARAIARRFGEVGNFIVSGLVGLFAAAALFGNIALVSAGQPARTARAAFEQDLARGLVAHVPDGATVTIPKRFGWIDYDSSGPDGISTRGLLYQVARRRADLEAPGDPRATFALGYGETSHTWSIRPVRARAQGWLTACNGSAIANGDFILGLRCWAAVPASAASVHREEKCFAPDFAGKPFAVLHASLGTPMYLAQAFTVGASAPRITLRVWSEGQVTVSVGIVYPVGTGIGSERTLDTFVPPQIMTVSGDCSGAQPLRKTYTVDGFLQGDRIQLRLHAAAIGSGGSAAFDRISSLP